MTDINNSIKVDASQAINSFNSLGKSVKRANAVLTQYKINADGTVEEAFNGAAKAGGNLANQTVKVGKSTKAAAAEAQRLSLSWETIGRIVQTQVLLRSINAVRDAFFESADAAAEFQLQIGRINAISNQSETSFDDLSSRIKDLSIAIGRDLGETGAAVFEALQNDLGTTNKTFELLETQASNLAIVTGGSLGDAVNALSSVIKVYGEESEDAANASGTLFGAINAGRLTLDELESRLGTVIPLAGRLGVSFEQAASAVATISLAGVDAATAQTQLRNVLNKLIKPTELLKEAFIGLRVDGFKELLDRTGGDLVGALKQIANELGNDEEAIAKAFNTIRGNLGVFNLLSNNGKLASDTLKTVQESALGLNDEVAKINELDARQAEINAAKLGVIFTEVGEDALKLKNEATAAFLAVIDDSESARTALVALSGGAVIATTAFVGLRQGILATRAAAIGFGGPFGLVVAGLAAFTVGAGLALLATNKLEDALTGLSEEAELTSAVFDAAKQTIEDIGVDRIEELNERFSDTTSVLGDVLRESQLTAEGIIEAFESTNSFLQQYGENVVNSFADSRSRIISGITKEIKGLDKSIAKNTLDLAGAQQSLADFDFKASLKDLDKSAAAARALARSYKETAKAANDVAQAGLGGESRKAAENQIKAADAAAKFALRLAEASEEERKIASATAQVRAVEVARIDLLKRQLQLQKEIPREALKEQLAQLQNVNEAQKDSIEEQVANYNDLTRQVAEGVPKEVLQSQFDLIEQELAKLADALPEFSKNELVERFGFTELAEGVEEQLLNSLNNLDVQWTQSIQSLKDQLEGESFEATVKLNAEIDAAGAVAFIGDALSKAQAQSDPTLGLAERKAVIQDLVNTQIQAETNLDKAGVGFKSEIVKATDLLKQANQEGFFVASADNAQAIAGPTLAALKNVGEASTEELVTLRGALKEAIDFVAETPAGLGKPLLDSTKENLLGGLEAAFGAVQEKLNAISAQSLLGEQQKQELKSLQDLILSENEIQLDVDDQGIKDAKTQLDLTNTSAKNTARSTRDIGTQANNANSQVSTLNSTTGSLASSAGAAAGAFNRMAEAAKAALAAANAANAAGAGSFAYHGGLQYFANGGQSRGPDRNMAMVADGEFIVNPRSTRQFLPQLQAINAGNAPSSASSSSGGDTNISIGDINVSSTSDVPSQTARDISLALKRELRRGTSR